MSSYYDWASGEVITSARLNAPWNTSGDLKIRTAGAIVDVNGNELIKFPATVASAVNEITITNAATGASPSLSATGGDDDIGITITPKGDDSGIAIGQNGTGIQRYAENKTGANVFRKCTATLGDTSESGVATDISVLTLPVPPSAQKGAIAGGMVYLARTSKTSAPGAYIWTAKWGYESGQSGEHLCNITALKATADAPTIAFSTDTLVITLPAYYYGFVTCDFADKNCGSMASFEWGTNFT